MRSGPGAVRPARRPHRGSAPGPRGLVDVHARTAIISSRSAQSFVRLKNALKTARSEHPEERGLRPANSWSRRRWATSRWKAVVSRNTSTGVVFHQRRVCPSRSSGDAVVVGVDHLGRQAVQHPAGLGLVHEDVDVDVDGASGPFGAERQGECTTEGMGDRRPRGQRRCQDLVDDRRHAGRNGGNSECGAVAGRELLGQLEHGDQLLAPGQALEVRRAAEQGGLERAPRGLHDAGSRSPSGRPDRSRRRRGWRATCRPARPEPAGSAGSGSSPSGSSVLHPCPYGISSDTTRSQRRARPRHSQDLGDHRLVLRGQLLPRAAGGTSGVSAGGRMMKTASTMATSTLTRATMKARRYGDTIEFEGQFKVALSDMRQAWEGAIVSGVRGVRDLRGTSGLTSPTSRYFGLFSRCSIAGQESAGIAVSDGTSVRVHRGMGLVAQVFSAAQVQEMGKGSILALGHTRYSTTGASRAENAHPLPFHHPTLGPGAIAHNGNLLNSESASAPSSKRRAPTFDTALDTEVMARLIEHTHGKTWEDVIQPIVRACGRRIFVRDHHAEPADRASRPLRLQASLHRLHPASRPACSRNRVGDLRAGHCACQLRARGAAGRDGLDGRAWRAQRQPFRHRASTPCAFSSSFTSRVLTRSSRTASSRTRGSGMGHELAKEAPVEADMVVAFPDSGTPGGDRVRGSRGSLSRR